MEETIEKPVEISDDSEECQTDVSQSNHQELKATFEGRFEQLVEMFSDKLAYDQTKPNKNK
jgi:hypothetical protein